jgi:predicted amidohydrolase YtcJ
MPNPPSHTNRPCFGAAGPVLLLAVIVAAFAGAARAQEPELLLINGKILTVDARFSTAEALAVRAGRIAAVGNTADVRRLASPRARVIDLQGRTVVPGLIDSHLHAIRAGQTFATEVNWSGARSLSDALTLIRDAARTRPAGAWLVVAGGWNERQFAERRRPTAAELQAAAPNRPVYVQLGYGWIAMTPAGFTALKIATDADLPRNPVSRNASAAFLGRLERNADGTPTGIITGAQDAIVALFDRLPKPTFAEQVEGTKQFFRELNRLGVTGVLDPGGNNVGPADYQPVLTLWRNRELTVRVGYNINGQTAGAELDDFERLTSLLPMRFGDDMLRFNGLGERVTFAMNNNDKPTIEQKEKYYAIARWAAERGMTITMHWNSDASVGELLSIWERVNREIPLAPLRWSIAHLNDASDATLRRMKALGIGWTVQDASLYFGGEQFLKARGRDAARRAPPVETGRRIGVPIGAGTDAHRVAPYHPFTALQWLLDGRDVGGVAIRGSEEIPSRADALRFYTIGSAWFSHDDDTRGSLEVGKLADLAVLSHDYMTVPTEQIGAIESVLTMVGGKIVYAASAFGALAGTQ